MLYEIVYTVGLCAELCLMDIFLTQVLCLQGVYYLIHSVHNWIIVDITLNEVVNSILDFNYILNSERNDLALQYVFALHIYHTIMYWRKFRLDDWLHHLLMLGIALPIGTLTNSRSLLGYGLFFTTGLPGAIDYFLLFLTRNNWLNRTIEKNINAWLNTWIRSPGCISHSTLILMLVSVKTIRYSLDWYMGILVSVLTCWNGQYFMRQVLENNIEVRQKLS